MNPGESNLLFPLVIAVAALTSAFQLLLSFLVLSDEEPASVPPDLNTEGEVRGAAVILFIACAFLVCGGAMVFFHTDRRGLVVLPLAALVFCIWSGLRVILCAGGTPRPSRALALHGLGGLAVSAVAGSLGIFLLWSP
ncbi:MAG: hypothetical protein KIS92_24115 [Planctomycetota bacterium]|nr:hypothetical protein [Planctomycetota bacterium]